MKLEFKNNLGIKDAVTRNVITATSDTSIDKIANIMTEYDISAVVILDENVEGIVTNAEIIAKVVSKNISPKDITADMVMTKYVTISEDTSLIEASKLMIKNHTKLLLVMDGDELEGVITFTDIVRISPELIELFVENESLEDIDYINTPQDDNIYEGTCDECGQYTQIEEVKGQYLCQDCMDNFED